VKRATEVLPRGSWSGRPQRDRITLAFDDRFRRRIALTADGGFRFLLDLPEACVLRDGDGLALDDGGVVAVAAATEALIEVTAGSPAALARLAWHLGNRHLPAQIEASRILIRDDHVIVDMLRGLGATVRPVTAAFDPEGGAYGQHNHDPGHRHGAGANARHLHRHDDHRGHDHGHEHHHGHDHDHAHGQEHGPAAAPERTRG